LIKVFFLVCAFLLNKSNSFSGFDGKAATLPSTGMNMASTEGSTFPVNEAENEKIFVVTGSTDGIGRHTSKKLAETGARVIVHGRNTARCEETVQWIKDITGNEKIDYFVADLSETSNVHTLADQICEKYSHIDCLINNAGVFEEQFQTTPDGFEMTFAVNVAAPFVLTKRLLPMLQKRPGSRLIIVSSISQGSRIDFENLQFEKGGYDEHSSYSLSKLCDAMLAFEMAARFGSGAQPTVNTLDPGTVNTKMLLAGWGMCGIPVTRANNEFWLATSPDVEGVNGKYFTSCRESRASQVAYDPEARRRLWEYLERTTAVTYDDL